MFSQASVCLSTPGEGGGVALPQSQVLSQVTGPRSFPGGTPVLAGGVTVRMRYPPPSQDGMGHPPGQIRMTYPPSKARMGYPRPGQNGVPSWPGQDEIPPMTGEDGYPHPQPGLGCPPPGTGYVAGGMSLAFSSRTFLL